MKKHLILLLSLCIFSQLNAQEIWLEAGLKGGVGLSFLHNKNIVNDDNYGYLMTPMYNIGGKFAVNFGAKHGFSLEAMLGTLGQDFDYQLNGPTKDQSEEIDWKTIDAYVLYKLVNNRMYVELGPMYSIVRSVSQTAEASSETFYQKNYLSGVLGFGGLVAGSETFTVSTGLRFHYALNDFINSAGQKANYPNPIRATAYDSYAETRVAYAEFLVELNFGIGRFAKTSCHERMRFFRSGR